MFLTSPYHLLSISVMNSEAEVLKPPPNSDEDAHADERSLCLKNSGGRYLRS